MDDLLEMSDSAFMEKAGELRSIPTTTSPDNTDAEAALAAVEQEGVEGEEEVTTPTTEESTDKLQTEVESEEAAGRKTRPNHFARCCWPWPTMCA